MKMYDFIEKVADLLQKHYPHLRHSLRSEIDIDDFLKKELMKILREA